MILERIFTEHDLRLREFTRDLVSLLHHTDNCRLFYQNLVLDTHLYLLCLLIGVKLLELIVDSCLEESLGSRTLHLNKVCLCEGQVDVVFSII